jgi:hypothetical protein
MPHSTSLLQFLVVGSCDRQSHVLDGGLHLPRNISNFSGAAPEVGFLMAPFPSPRRGGDILDAPRKKVKTRWRCRLQATPTTTSGRCKPKTKIMSVTSPQSASTGGSPESGSASGKGAAVSAKETELLRKRARDRKAQQAMRDRTKWTINNLTDQVLLLNQVIETKTRDLGALDSRVRVLETENAQLRTQNAALQLSLMGSQPREDNQSLLAKNDIRPPWQLLPANHLKEGYLGDQILHAFASSNQRPPTLQIAGTVVTAPVVCLMPNFAALWPKKASGSPPRVEDELSNIVADLVRSFPEINKLPDQVAVFMTMYWQVKVCPPRNGGNAINTMHDQSADIRSGTSRRTRRAGISSPAGCDQPPLPSQHRIHLGWIGSHGLRSEIIS